MPEEQRQEYLKGLFKDNSITIIVNLEGNDYLVGAKNVSKEDFDKKFNKCVNVISKAIKEKENDTNRRI